jgi:uncharacterized protein (DUF1015 family)
MSRGAGRAPLVAPFAAEHYAALDRLDDLLAPPYDVIAEPERATLAARHEHNIVHLILPRGDGDRYQEAARLLEHWRRAGVVRCDASPAVYVVQQEFSVDGRAKVRTGLIGAVAVEPFDAGRIKPHERTHAGPKQDRLSLMRSTRTMFEALLMMSRDPEGELARLVARATQAGTPWAEGCARDCRMRAWRLTGSEGAALAAAAGRDALYIADGHHRFETAVAFRREAPAAARTLALIVPVRDPGLVVRPTHRLVYGGPVSNRIVEQLKTRCVVHEPPPGADHRGLLERAAETGGGCVVVFPGGRLLALGRRSDTEAAALAAFDPPVRRLDVTWADGCVVATLRAAMEGPWVGYSSDADEVVAEVSRGQAQAGVLLNPPAVDDVLAVADAGAFMPPKSTYFQPKVPSGLVMLPYDRA